MKMVSRTTMSRAGGTAGMMGVARMAGMATAMMHTGSSSTTTTATTLNDIKMKTTCGDLT